MIGLRCLNKTSFSAKSIQKRITQPLIKTSFKSFKTVGANSEFKSIGRKPIHLSSPIHNSMHFYSTGMVGKELWSNRENLLVSDRISFKNDKPILVHKFILNKSAPNFPFFHDDKEGKLFFL